MNLVTRQIYGLKKNDGLEGNWRFDTISDSPNTDTFIIRRESDNVEQLFTFAQIIDGTYETFISGTLGRVKEMYHANSNYTLIQNNTTLQLQLDVNAGKPELNGLIQGRCLLGFDIITDLRNDFVITFISHKEMNGNNQRSNFAITGVLSSHNIMFQFNTANFAMNAGDGAIVSPQGAFAYSALSAFSVYSFARIGGVFSVTRNNISVPVTAGSGFTLRSSGLGYPNRVTWGGNGTGLGKMNKYQHLGIVYGKDLSNYNISILNSELMTRYAIS